MNKARLSKLVGALAVTVMGLLSMGCGANPAYEPDYPQGYPPPPPPLTSEELAARQQAQLDAQAQQEVAVGSEQGDEYADTDPSALTEFRSTLDGHGAWVDDPTYGTVWVPAESEVGTDFQPYVTAGHWTYADDTSWVWVSDYDWGWAPFHYGRWVHLPGHGWSWIPGRRYAGAWVVWRTGPVDYGYIGWAPAPPTWYWRSGVAVGWSFGFYSHHHHYVYCAHDYVYHDHVHSYVVRGPAARLHDSRTAEYVPAQPSANGGGDRILANPSVNGGANGRVVAQPGVGGGRVAASPSVARGPRPDEAGIKNSVVVAPPKEHAGLQRAQAFGSARSAIARGASPPAHSRVATAMPSGGAGASANVAPGRSFAGSMTADGASRGPAVAPLPPRQSALPSYRDPAGPSQSSAFAARPSAPSSTWTPPSYAQPRPSADGPLPSYRSTPSYSSPAPSVAQSPSFRSSPSVTSPSYRSSPSFRSSPSVSSSPSFRSSPSVSAPRSTPSFRSSPSVSAPRSTPSFRSSPSVSAPRSTPSFRSSPSVSAPRSSPSFRSSPSVSSPSRGGGASLGRRR